MEASGPMSEPTREDKEEEEEGEGMEEDRRKGSSSTDNLVPRQVLAVQWATHAVPKF